MMYVLEHARPEEVSRCAEILSDGRAFQREQGFVQWTDDYPNEDTVREDVARGCGYVIRVEGEIAGYLYIGFEGDRSYDVIDGAWESDEPYAVVHRIAISRAFRGQGLSDVTFDLVDGLCLERGFSWVRIDTDFPNKRMQHVLEKNGFAPRGTVLVRGNPRIGYEKKIVK